MPITPEISRKLLELKEESGLTFKQIGEEVGSSEANVRRYITGETKAPDKKLLYDIARILGGDPDEIFGKRKPEPVTVHPHHIDFSMLERQEQRHQKEIASLKAAYNSTILSKDERIEELKTERQHLRIAVVVLAAVVFAFMVAYLIPDILNGDWGHIVYTAVAP
jgi:transcriptional regulator with XRE-family HTH domain